MENQRAIFAMEFHRAVDALHEPLMLVSLVCSGRSPFRSVPLPRFRLRIPSIRAARRSIAVTYEPRSAIHVGFEILED